MCRGELVSLEKILSQLTNWWVWCPTLIGNLINLTIGCPRRYAKYEATKLSAERLNEIALIIDVAHDRKISLKEITLTIPSSTAKKGPVKSLSEPPRGAGWVVLTGGVLILSTEDKA